MRVFRGARPVGAAVVALLVLGACSQSAAPPQGNSPTAATVAATPMASLDARFDATAAVGGGMNSSNSVSTDDIKTVFGSIPQIDKLALTANSSPPGAKGGDVTSVSVIGQDGSGLLKGLDPTAKQSLAEVLLTTAGTAWPNASVSLLVSDPAGGGGQIIGSRARGGPNTIIVS
jgi:hypothetical protein